MPIVTQDSPIDSEEEKTVPKEAFFNDNGDP
jgi:hypothetical protein